jgi:hypothetical protein
MLRTPSGSVLDPPAEHWWRGVGDRSSSGTVTIQTPDRWRVVNDMSSTVRAAAR